jgi:hypothetical protein
LTGRAFPVLANDRGGKLLLLLTLGTGEYELVMLVDVLAKSLPVAGHWIVPKKIWMRI